MTVEIKQNKTFGPSILLLALWLCLFLLVNPVVARDDEERGKPRETPKIEEPKKEEIKVEAPKVETPKIEESKKEEVKIEAPKVETPKVEESKKEESRDEKKEEIKVEIPKVEVPKVEAPKVEEPKKEEVKVEAPKPKVERPKKDDLPEFVPQLEPPLSPKNEVGQVITPQTTTVIQGEKEGHPTINEPKIERPKYEDEGDREENKEIKEEKGKKEGIKEDVEDLPESIIENPIIPIIPSNTEPKEILPTSTPVTTEANSNENLQYIENYDLGNFLIEVPKGSTFATKVPFSDQRTRTTNTNKELLDKVTSVVLTEVVVKAMMLDLLSLKIVHLLRSINTKF